MSGSKEAEGIALLSMYNDEDMDAEEDLDEEREENGKEESAEREKEEDKLEEKADGDDEELEIVPESFNESTLLLPSPPSRNDYFALKSPSPELYPPPSMEVDVQRLNRGSLAIVDYAHDEVTMSPDIEQGEILSTGRVTSGAKLLANEDTQEGTPGSSHALTPTRTNASQVSSTLEQLKKVGDKLLVDSFAAIEHKTAQANDAVAGTEIEVNKENDDPLAMFLPPPPTNKCSEKLQDKINNFLRLKSGGRSFNEELRKSKGYRNPDFLQHAVKYEEIDQIGSCFSKDVFDPHGYDNSDFYDAIEADMKREMEKKEQERKKSQRVEFAQGGTQAGSMLPQPKIGVQIPGVPSIPASMSSLLAAAPAPDALAREGRQNKKTKWDKVDGDRRIPLATGGQDAVSTVSAHAALLSAANAGAGYTAFAQQKRREAEEKRSHEGRSEKRS
ncbi:hypothetical protein AMTRI_Chr06g176600 [Amborella trichopoda]|uniref:uncharacterized protein LOC18442073 isoform X1 n=2 Tax=Amborella trichopoda TaxID=13333 RepID=UPI0005D414D1|nr:uncharacterized protein LOC18442073 isoform X1 [Amborella trichopoda]XP_011626198.1 uncharacterized protein LOC18442073 isoform X1 [Amborella trichopoda]XP_011626199.1 uncharacterized protein LOC18442073 isoform X1 [Amborella trichopoda]XP_011626200.1 uncharacterized protein LOC18442073 isoform X1 [Amborella trichopoda]XP_020527734.1 uncharacterized protein LOC18442073 isoform X1 [Amborella trichopoda]XP_020527735.1 uncharacterized protein LOC18442073 isoform X1 [Amborella trichopoda]XP_02|eukprot:XP_011626197.1 uncharacterized protein LOC18442073 isoform X1 [Amborella trichopoda]